MLTLLLGQPTVLAAVVAVLGALIGSFLNVVALRLPRMIDADIRHQCHLELGLEAEPEAPRVSLIHPGSQCPACGTPIKPWHNVPVLGWLWLRGRAACCGAPISVQYPLVEAACALLSAICALHFGPSPQLLAALVFTWMLLALAVIDWRTQLLPDDLTLPLLWLGLLASTVPLFATPVSAIVGAAAGYLSLWSVYWTFKLLTGREGMGYGDFKLLAAFGAWLGWQSLAEIILLSSVVGAVVGALLIALRRQRSGQPMPYGPYLAGAGWIALLWGEQLRDRYFHLVGWHG